jgi:hypothetical protein
MFVFSGANFNKLKIFSTAVIGTAARLRTIPDERGATLVTSNLPFDEWTSIFGSERTKIKSRGRNGPGTRTEATRASREAIGRINQGCTTGDCAFNTDQILQMLSFGTSRIN